MSEDEFREVKGLSSAADATTLTGAAVAAGEWPRGRSGHAMAFVPASASRPPSVALFGGEFILFIRYL